LDIYSVIHLLITTPYSQTIYCLKSVCTRIFYNGTLSPLKLSLLLFPGCLVTVYLYLCPGCSSASTARAILLSI